MKARRPRRRSRLHRLEPLESRRLLTAAPPVGTFWQSSRSGEGEGLANVRPSFTAADPAATLEDAGAIMLMEFAVFDPGDPSESSQSVLGYQVSEVSNPELFAAPPSISNDGTLTYMAAADQFGESTFSVIVQDDGGTDNDGVDTSVSQTFTISITPVNDIPDFSVGEVVVAEDAPFQDVPRFITDFNPGPNEGDDSNQSQVLHDEGADGLVDPLSADNNAPTFLGALSLGSNIVSGTVGTAKVSGNVDVFAFEIEAGFQLDRLTVLEYAYLVPPSNSNERNAFLGIDDTDSFPYDVFELDINNNPFFDETAFIGGTVFGLGDLPEVGGGDILRRAGVITGSRFTPPLGAGTYTFYIQQTGPTNRYALDLRVTKATKQSPLSYTITNVSDPSLFLTEPNIDVEGHLKFTPAVNASGTATFDVTVQDSGGTDNGGIDTSVTRVGTIVIEPVNDPPTFVANDPPATIQGSGQQVVSAFITEFDPGPDNEADQTVVSYTVSNFSNPQFFSVNPVIDVAGTLTYTVRPDIIGTVSFDVTVTDSGGGSDTSETRSISITVVPPPIVDDFGDAPESYPVTLADNGARHVAGSVFLGSAVTAEADGQPTILADGDAGDDGAEFLSDLVAYGDSASTGGAVVSASTDGFLDAWMDFNGDGDWDDDGEQFATSLALVSGANQISIPIPAGAVAGATFARFRFSSLGGLATTGAASDGEVEDYRVVIIDGSAMPDAEVELVSPTMILRRRGNQVFVVNGDTVLFSAPIEELNAFRVIDGDSAPIVSIKGSEPDTFVFSDPTLLRMGPTMVVDGRFVRSVVREDDAVVLQIETDAAWQNILQVNDVNNSGDVTAGDVLRIINELARREFSDRETDFLENPLNVVQWPDTYFDQNGDGQVTALDALRVINHLARVFGSAEPEGTANDQVVAVWDWQSGRDDDELVDLIALDQISLF